MTDIASALWLSAHPTDRSLNGALRAAGVAHLSRDSAVATSDLYAMGWQAALTEDDLGGVGGDQTFGTRTREAHLAGTLAPDIRTEQAKLREADLLVLQFPLWWGGMPAILKGWFDRVFVNGFAFNVTNAAGRTLKYGEGGLEGKRALVVVTAGDRAPSFAAGGVNGHLEALLFPLLHGILWYTGIQPLHPHLIAATDRREFGGLNHERDRLLTRLDGLPAEEPIDYRTLRHGGYDRDQRLVTDAAPLDLGIHECVAVPA
ncbi:NAD(P)H-dependent oxidoreductase [Ruania alkalisoli]|uniref:NAD(P)H-dependent oxidoreductase n=1 Tax=Ruania alkalisoli TaxID=2779775 RepID=A0A7M1SU67_9MICO|nr:NAD(P)H-dependent oxidoreductase [Ruania alkalisoli]QOR70312.1 NAD(P)H-dependent oxidoreductase [Ruania alkalisoli]